MSADFAASFILGFSVVFSLQITGCIVVWLWLSHLDGRRKREAFRS